MSQLALPLAWPEDPAAAAFVVSPANAAAVAMLDQPARWPVATAILAGPRKSGRSLLARVFARRTDARVIDGADRRAETELFHAWNEAQAIRRPLLLVVDQSPPAWRPALPDLASRLAACPVATIEPPDDALIAALLERGLTRRGIEPRVEVIDWLVRHLDRTYVAVAAAVDTIDAAMLERHRRLTLPFVRDALAVARRPVRDEVDE